LLIAPKGSFGCLFHFLEKIGSTKNFQR